MRRRLFGLALLGLILFLLGGIIYTWSTPRLVDISPAAQAVDIPAGTALSLAFSRPMQADTVQENLVIDPPRSGKFTWQGNRLTFTPEQPWPGGQTVKVRLKTGARAAGLLRLPLRAEQAWSFTTRYPLLVYLSLADGQAGLYLLDPQEETSQRIAGVPGDVLDFDVDASGAAIYFSASQGEGGSAIYRWDRPTGQVSLLFECPQAICRFPQVSPEGDLLAYERTPLSGDDSEQVPQVWLLPLQGINRPGSGENEAGQEAPAPPRLAGDPENQTEQPAWSPTGLLTFYDSTATTFLLLDPETGEATSFSSQTGMPGSWDPPGDYFVIPEITNNDIQGTQDRAGLQPIPSSHLIRYERKEGVLEDLTQADNLDDSAPAYSPIDGRLAFARRYLDLARWTPGRQLWMMQPDGSDAQPLTDESFYNHYDFAWSPEGDELAYVRFNQDLLTEPPEIWLIRADGTLARQLVIGGYAPKWMP